MKKYNMKITRKSISVNIFLMLLLTAVFTAYYLTMVFQTYLNSDDIYFMRELRLNYAGINNTPLNQYLSLHYIIWNIWCYLIGFGKYVCYMAYASYFAILIFLSLYLAAFKKGQGLEWKIVPLFTLMAVVTITSENAINTKYHVNPIVAVLLTCIFIQYIKDNRNNKLFVLLPLLIIASSLQNDILVFAVCWLPLILVASVNIWYGKEVQLYKKVLLYTLISCIIGVVLLGVIQKEFSVVTDSYSGRISFLNRGSLMKNIEILFNGILSYFSANVHGKMIFSLKTILGSILAINVIVMLGFVFYDLFMFVFKGKDISLVDVFISASIVCNLIAVGFSSLCMDDTAIRFIFGIHFLLPIYCCRFWIKKWEKVRECIRIRIKVDFEKASIILCICLLLIGINKGAVSAARTGADNLAEYLVSNNIEYSYAPYWTAGIVQETAKGKINIQPAEPSQAYQKRIAVHWPISEEWLYDEKREIHDIIITEQGNPYSYYRGNLSVEDLKAIYGTPDSIEQVDVFSICHYNNIDLRNSSKDIFNEAFHSGKLPSAIGENGEISGKVKEYNIENSMEEKGKYSLEIIGDNIGSLKVLVQDQGGNTLSEEYSRNSNSIKLIVNSDSENTVFNCNLSMPDESIVSKIILIKSLYKGGNEIYEEY